MMKQLITFSISLAITAAVWAQDTVKPLWQPFRITPREGAQHMALSGNWELSYMDKPITSLQELAARKEPFTTAVPSSVHWSFFRAGKLPHPYYNMNANLYKWLDEKVWYYQREFQAPATNPGDLVFLCFDGIDYFAKVWVNDSLAGMHEGMFAGPDAEISKWLKPGKNKITVEVRAGNWGQKATDADNLPRNATGEKDYNKRTGYNPRASGRIIKPWIISGGSGAEAFFSVGMWRGVRLEVVPPYHLERPFLTTRQLTPSKASLHLSMEVLANAHSLQQRLHPWNNTQILHWDTKVPPVVPVKEALQVTVELVDQKGKVAAVKEIPLRIDEGRNWLEEDITVNDPAVWQPAGMGEQPLYNVRIALKKGSQVIDRLSFEYGIRTIEQVPSAGPRTADRWQNWQFVVNGRKIFVKGMNWTPADVLLDLSPERYRWALEAARDMGVQLIRVWGGGLLETDDFYKICNELGIMVWQDFPIGNQDTPGYPQDIWEAQVVQNIFRLRNHPSLAVWCGGNEFNPYSYGNAATIGILERSLHTFDDTRLFVRTTPDAGSMHSYPDMDPVWYKPNFRYIPWMSETGMHSMPEAGLLRELVSDKEFFDLGKMWDKSFAAGHRELIHHFAEYGPGRVPRMLSRASHITDMSNPTIESIAEATQIGAGEFYQVMSEKVQGNYPITTGLMPWVFKRHWPVIAIQLMDWFGQPGAPYYFLKRTYEPTHVAIDIPRLLWKAGERITLRTKITHALPQAIPGAGITIRVYDDAFRQLAAYEQPVSVAAGTSVTDTAIDSFLIPSTYKDRFLFLLAELKDASGKLVSRSFYYPRVLSQMEDAAFYEAYMRESNPWPTLEKGPWLRPTVGKTRTSLQLAVVQHNRLNNEAAVIQAVVTNNGKVPAFMTTLDVTGAKRAFTATDNFYWLMPGEKREITLKVHWREKKAGNMITAQAWNAPPVKAKL